MGVHAKQIDTLHTDRAKEAKSRVERAGRRARDTRLELLTEGGREDTICERSSVHLVREYAINERNTAHLAQLTAILVVCKTSTRNAVSFDKTHSARASEGRYATRCREILLSPTSPVPTPYTRCSVATVGAN